MIKEFETWLILDYKTGKFRVMKKRMPKEKATEIPIKIKLNVTVPEMPVLTAKGEIVLNETKVNQMTIEEL